MCVLHLHDLPVLSCLLVWLPDNHMGTAAYVKSLRQQYHRSIVMPMCGIFARLRAPATPGESLCNKTWKCSRVESSFI